MRATVPPRLPRDDPEPPLDRGRERLAVERLAAQRLAVRQRAVGVQVERGGAVAVVQTRRQ
jgi:hypothetical protein